jgi:copper chaperone CopZ
MVESYTPYGVYKTEIVMEKLIFETDVACTSLLDRIHTAVKKVNGIYTWSLDLESAYRLLTVEGKALDYREIINQLSIHGVGANRLYEE